MTEGQADEAEEDTVHDGGTEGPGRTEPPEPAEPAQHQGWMAGTRPGRVVLGTLLAGLTFIMVAWNLPDSEIEDELRPALRPVVNSMAIDQAWGVFAPNPTTVSIAVEAGVVLASGSVIRYEFPDGDPLVGAYREFRWRKLERKVRLDDEQRYWRPTADWIARKFADRDPVEVVLYRRFAETPEPGSGDERVWETVEFYRLRIAGDGTEPAGTEAGDGESTTTSDEP